jgi:hypothetical protein
MDRKKLSALVLGLLIVATAAFVSAMMEPVQAFNCKIVSCPAPACEANEHLRVPPGQCCPVCVPN